MLYSEREEGIKKVFQILLTNELNIHYTVGYIWGWSRLKKKEEVKLAEIKCVWSSCVLYSSYTSVNIKPERSRTSIYFILCRKSLHRQKIKKSESLVF